ncbi:MAG: ATP-binding protein [Bacteroidota bacterium]
MPNLIARRIKSYLKELGEFFPIISLTGPRQAGKTTLLREMFKDYRYVSLEDPTLRHKAIESPKEFLSEYNDLVIFDEAQRWPDLFSYLQIMVDGDDRTGRFIISGSQNFLLRKNITQSLAGRVGIARLLPLDQAELNSARLLAKEADQAVIRGGYPRLISKNPSTELFFSSYLASYLERDVAELINWSNLDLFQRFIRIVATYAGQPLNLSKIANDTGVTLPTLKSWIGILEQSYIVFRLPAFFRNFGKRLTKTSKLYFYDTGLLCYLLEIMNGKELGANRLRGAIFENYIIADAFKSFFHKGHTPNLYYYRDNQKQEVDLVYERGNHAWLYEIKSADRFKPDMVKTLDKVASLWDRPTSSTIIYQGDEARFVGKSFLQGWREIEWKRG